MNGAFYIGATGLDAQQHALDVVANNIANINTPGFKRSSVRFSELVATPREGVELPMMADDRAAFLSGVMADGNQRIWAQGDLKQTGSAFDIAIDGSGFIEVMGTDGAARYWRGGTIKVGEDGFLATSDGSRLRAAISVPRGAADLVIGRDGMVSAAVAGSGIETIGQIDIAMVEDPDSLIAVGNGYYQAADGRPAPLVVAGEDGSGAIVQGAVEGSNVQLSDQMVTLLLLQRAYAANAQVVQAGDQLLSIANTLRR